MSIVPSGRPSPPCSRVTSEPSMVPTVRFTFSNGDVGPDRFTRVESRSADLDQFLIQGLVQAVVLLDDLPTRLTIRHIGHVEDRSKVEPLRLPVIDSPPHVENFCVSNRFIKASKTEFREVLTYFLGDEFEEVDDEFR